MPFNNFNKVLLLLKNVKLLIQRKALITPDNAKLQIPAQIKLSIDRTFVSDSRKVTCLVWSHFGQATTAVLLGIRLGRAVRGCGTRFKLEFYDLFVLGLLLMSYPRPRLGRIPKLAYNKQSFMSVIKKSSGRRSICILGTLFRLPKYFVYSKSNHRSAR